MFTEDALTEIGVAIDDAFFLIGAAILLIELVEALVKGKLRKKTLLEMFVSASTQIPYLLVQVVLLTTGYVAFYLLSELLPWTFDNSLLVVITAVLIADFFYYWEHRIAHEVRLLWTQHAVHHSSRDMNIITGIRFGPLEGVWSLIAHVPMVLIGFSAEAVVFGSLVVLAYQTWLHTELIGKLGPLEWVLNTPSHHRVHHGSDDKYLDKNYAGFLIIWDRMFGTFQVEEETPRYGLARDFDSQNPLKVWFSEIPGLWRDVRDAKTWGEAFGYMMHGPGWTPRR